mmetsp:Transcript_24654/g.58672  ORF Transcript_24654/g.58672 Transcript_24654/m.58672 type:complete len:633 (-) Transcript_24654:240-2138(-)
MSFRSAPELVSTEGQQRRWPKSFIENKAPIYCQVPGCEAELSELKIYNQRYRVCKFHLKTDATIINGVAQRFCQQCSKFHELSEFDAGRRSCRARLSQHNKRRRRTAAETSSNLVTSLPAEGHREDNFRDIAPHFEVEERNMVQTLQCGDSIESNLSDVVSRISSAEYYNSTGHPEFARNSQPGSYQPVISVVRLTFKLFGLSISELPRNLQNHFLQLMPGIVQVSGYSTTQWTHLHVEIVEEAYGGRGAAVPRLQDIAAHLVSPHCGGPWRGGVWMCQRGDETIMVESGKVIDAQDLISKNTAVERTMSVLPLAIPCSGLRHFEGLLQHPSSDQCSMGGLLGQARHGQEFLPLEMAVLSTQMGSGAVVRFTLREAVHTGAVRIDVFKGMLCGSTKTVVATDDDRLRQEVNKAAKLIDEEDIFAEEVGALLSYTALKSGEDSRDGMVWGQSSRLLKQIACNMLCFACCHGLTAILRVALDVLSAESDSPAAVADAIANTHPGFNPLLHRAVASRDPQVVACVLDWAMRENYVWDIRGINSDGLSALNLACSLENPTIVQQLQEYDGRVGHLTTFQPELILTSSLGSGSSNSEHALGNVQTMPMQINDNRELDPMDLFQVSMAEGSPFSFSYM